MGKGGYFLVQTHSTIRHKDVHTKQASIHDLGDLSHSLKQVHSRDVAGSGDGVLRDTC